MFLKKDINFLKWYKIYWNNVDKIMNWKYLILTNSTLYKSAKELDINTIYKSNVIQDFFPNLIKPYKYFDYFTKIDKNKIKEFKDINMKSFNKILNSKQIRWNVKKSINKKGNTQYMLWYSVNIKNIKQVQNFLDKNELDPIWSINTNIYNPNVFLNEVILYFIDLILFDVSTNKDKISNLLKSIFIWKENIVLNILKDKEIRSSSKWIIQNDKYYNYFILTILERIIWLWKIDINLFLFFEEDNWYLFNQLVKNIDNNIVFEKNKLYKWKTAVETLNLLNNNLNWLANDFWNLITDKNLVISDDLSYYYEEQIKYLKNNILNI